MDGETDNDVPSLPRHTPYTHLPSVSQVPVNHPHPGSLVTFTCRGGTVNTKACRDTGVRWEIKCSFCKLHIPNYPRLHFPDSLRLHVSQSPR